MFIFCVNSQIGCVIIIVGELVVVLVELHFVSIVLKYVHVQVTRFLTIHAVLAVDGRGHRQ